MCDAGLLLAPFLGNWFVTKGTDLLFCDRDGVDVTVFFILKIKISCLDQSLFIVFNDKDALTFRGTV